ncbi:MAG TPA: YdcF family protein [Myxococcota bacterium]|nr:YdcF family protein [Myxococcota bacterium]
MPSLFAMALGACGPDEGEGEVSRDDVPFVPEVHVDLVSPDVPDTTIDTAIDAVPDSTETTDTSAAPDTRDQLDTVDASETRDSADTVDAAETAATTDTVDTPDTVPVTACPTPTLLDSFPPPFPPSPFGEWPHADACLSQRHDVILVLGCPSKDDGSPSSCQERRAELADFLYEAGLAEHLIVSGAAVHTPHVEADALAALLIGRGIPEAAILKEPLARHTDENLYYGTRLMESRGWTSAIVVSDEPGHLVYTALCDANCCVELGRLTLWSFDVGRNGRVNAGHYALTPPGLGATEAECRHLSDLLLCTNLDDRLACRDDFRLDR